LKVTHYDDEISNTDSLWMRTASLYEIIKKFPPRHAYVKEKYWYEKLTDSEFKSKYHKLTDSDIIGSGYNDIVNIPDIHLGINSDNGDFKSLVKDVFGFDIELSKSFISPLKDIPDEKSGVIAFNYIWPSYGLEFLETSIQSILPYVKKYVIYLNDYSYIGNKASDKNIETVLSILSKFDDKIILIHNTDNNSSEYAKQDNIGFYIMETLNGHSNECTHIWLVQSDEVYEDHVCKDIINYCEYDGKNSPECIIVQPICYIDNPYWFVNPPEHFTRPTIIPADINVDLNNKILRRDLTFLHMSYVMPAADIVAKFTNWGHREDVQGRGIVDFLNKFDKCKTDKFIENFHPVEPNLYRTMAFTEDDINKRLFKIWIKSLVNHDWKDIIDPSLKDDKYVAFKAYLAIVSQFISAASNYIEVNSGNPLNLLALNTIMPSAKLFSFANHAPDYDVIVQRLVYDKLLNINVYNTDVKMLLPKFSNNFFNCIYFNQTLSNIRDQIIESWPKIKNFGIMFGMYSRNDKKYISELSSIIQKANNIECPWGNEQFRFYEIDLDILDTIDDTNKYSFWFARVRKN